MSTKKNFNYIFIGKKCGQLKRGSYTVTKRFADIFNCPFLPESNIKEIKDLNPYNKHIFTFQRCLGYSFRFDISSLLKLKYLLYTRDKIIAENLHSVMNGFSVYNRMKAHNNFIPMITDFIVKDKPDVKVLGFYVRHHVNPDAIDYFRQELKNLKYPIQIVTTGDKIDLSYYPKVLSHFHTHNNIEFISKISHYYFPQSAEFIDPFPNLLLECMQNNKQIISPRINGREHKDGIDDLLGLISYHHKLDDIFSDNYFDNRNNVIYYKHFEKFYKQVFEQGFNYYLEYNKYKTFTDWIASIQ